MGFEPTGNESEKPPWFLRSCPWRFHTPIEGGTWFRTFFSWIWLRTRVDFQNGLLRPSEKWDLDRKRVVERFPLQKQLWLRGAATKLLRVKEEADLPPYFEQNWSGNTGVIASTVFPACMVWKNCHHILNYCKSSWLVECFNTYCRRWIVSVIIQESLLLFPACSNVHFSPLQ